MTKGKNEQLSLLDDENSTPKPKAAGVKTSAAKGVPRELSPDPNPTETAADRSIAREAKGKVVELEKNNYGALILWRCDRKWWKMCRNSTLIYIYEVAPYLGKQPKVHPDKDRFFNTRDGICSIPNIKNFGAQLVRNGYKEKKITDAVIMYVLPKPLDAEAIEGFRREEKGKREKVNQILGGKALSSFLNSEGWKFLSCIYHLCCKLNRGQDQMMGARLRDKTIELLVTKELMERGEVPTRDALEQMYEDTGILMAYWRICYELEFIATEKAGDVGMHLYHMRTEIKRMIKELEEKGRVG